MFKEKPLLTTKQASSKYRKISIFLGVMGVLISWIELQFIDQIITTLKLKEHDLGVMLLVLILFLPIICAIVIVFKIRKFIYSKVSIEVCHDMQSNTVVEKQTMTESVLKDSSLFGIPNTQINNEFLPIFTMLASIVFFSTLIYVIPKDLLKYSPTLKGSFCIVIPLILGSRFMVNKFIARIIDTFSGTEKTKLLQISDIRFGRFEFFSFVFMNGSDKAIAVCKAYWKFLLFSAVMAGFCMVLMVVSFFN